MTTHLTHWHVAPDDPYKAPEQGGTFHLVGIVTGHPSLPDGETAHTSTVVRAEGRTVTTYSGTVYRLGQPDRKWLGWLRKNGIRYDGRAPVKVLEVKS